MPGALSKFIRKRKSMAKREAQQRIVQMILSGQASGCEITLSLPKIQIQADGL